MTVANPVSNLWMKLAGHAAGHFIHSFTGFANGFIPSQVAPQPVETEALAVLSRKRAVSY